MPRSHRILKKDGVYHVFNRGICRKNIHFCSEQVNLFFFILDKAVERFDVDIYAYCLMNNHYHLMIRTREANLNKFMQYFGSQLARGVNHMIGGDGALFKSRYRSILVEDDSYLFQLFKYIHLNPLEAKLVENIEDYQFSSYPAYLDLISFPVKINRQFMIESFGGIDELISYHEGSVSPVLSSFYSKKRLPSVLSKKTLKGFF